MDSTKRFAGILFVCCLVSPLRAAPEGAPFTLKWEAEALAAVRAEKETKHAKDASGGAYAYLPKAGKENLANASTLNAEFDAPAGRYRLRVRALAESNSSDSFFVIVDGRSQTVSPRELNKWEWGELDLTLGELKPHTLVIAAREPSRIDVIELAASEGAAEALAIRQSSPARPEPNGSRPLDINPPTFRWPGDWDKPYTLQLAPAGAAWDKAAGAVEFAGITDTFYRPLEPLTPGRWQWRVLREGKPFTGVETFEVAADTARWPIRPWEETYARFPRQHPRIYFRADQLAELKARAAGPMKAFIEKMVEQALKTVGKELTLAEDKPVAEVTDHHSRTIRRTSSKADAGRMMAPAGNQALLAMLLGRDDLAQEAIRRAMAATRLDPKGYTSQGVSDFANGAILRESGLVYDYLFDRLTPEQRAAIRAMIRARVMNYKPKLEQSVFSAHGWQHVVLDHATAALAVWDEDPEIEEWLKWAARMFVAHYPWYGGADGGSAEGAGYYTGTNLPPSLSTRLFWQAAADIDLAGNPWFRNDTYFLIYSHPVSGPISQFADNGHGAAPPDSSKASAALLMANLYDIPVAASYARAVLPGQSDEAIAARSASSRLGDCWLAWNPLGRTQARPLSELPPGRAFYDIGVAYVHSAIADAKNNVMFEFRSSPYGSFNHAHADQNSFNIAAFGEPLIIDSGHYTSYGDAHHYGWTVTTRAHNTILVDGKGQPSRNLDAYGRIVGFDQGGDEIAGRWAWVAGDASTAYRDPGLRQFIRQCVWLGPAGTAAGAGGAIQTYVIFDTIAAADGKPHRFDWLLHAAKEPEIQSGAQRVIVRGDKGEARVALLAPQQLAFAVTDKFDPPAENWRPDKQNKKFPEQWHLTVNPKSDAASQTFVAVVQVGAPGTAGRMAEPQLDSSGAVTVGADRVTLTDGGVKLERAGKELKTWRIEAR